MYRVSIFVNETPENNTIAERAMNGRNGKGIEITPECHGEMCIAFEYSPRRYKAFFRSKYGSDLEVEVCTEQVKDAIARRGLSNLAKQARQVVAVDEYGYVICEWFNEVND